MLPEETAKLIEEVLLVAEKTSTLDAEKRYEIYKSFGHSRLHLAKPEANKSSEPYYVPYLKETKNFTQADYALGWLAVITSEKVSPIWDEYWSTKDFQELEGVYISTILDPFRTLNLCKNLLLGLSEVELDTFELLYDNSTVMQIEENIPYKISCASAAVFQTLSFILCNGRNITKGFIFDDYVSFDRADFASEAAKAYSCSETNSFTKDVTFDENRRWEFWHWWLTQAIPQAWNLVQLLSRTTFPNP
jgi:Immunity protein Imm5